MSFIQIARQTADKMTQKNFILRIFGFIAILMLLNSCSSPDGVLSDSNAISKEEFERRENNALNDYRVQFKPGFRAKMKLWDAQITQRKLPVLSFTYDGKINMIITKVKLQKSSAPIHDIVFTTGNTSVNSTADVVYKGYDLANTQFRLACEGDSIAGSVHISYDKPVLKQNTNDSNFISHSLVASGFSVRYDKEDIVDFFLKTTKANIVEKTPMELQLNTLLYKRGDAMYIIVAYASSDIKTDNMILKEAVFEK